LSKLIKHLADPLANGTVGAGKGEGDWTILSFSRSSSNRVWAVMRSSAESGSIGLPSISKRMESGCALA
jgi:hypothetical protein